MHSEWKVVRSLQYGRAKQRTERDVVGTAYWTQKGADHGLYVKIHEDRWLCFRGRSLDALLRQFAEKPGAGGAASDYLIANGIATTPGEILRTRQLEWAKPKKRPGRLTTKLSANDIWNNLADRGALVVRRPVTAKEIAAAERTLGVRLPPSYVELVTRHGAPGLSPDGQRSTLHMLSYAVLTPKEIVRFTKEMRRIEPEMFEDEDSVPRVKAQLAKAVFFQIQADMGDGYVFLVDTADAKGEMRVADFAHDYIEELDWRPSSKVVFRSLAAATLHVAKIIERDLP